MEALPYYKWHWQRWRANRRVQRMTPAQKGIYRDLLDECWAEGFIPDDISALAEICCCSDEEVASAWQVLSNCFYLLEDGKLTNSTLEEQRTGTDAIRAARKVAGAAGGKQKLANAKQVPYRREEKRREEESREDLKPLASTAIAVPASPSVFTFPLTGKKTHIVTVADCDAWSAAYPAVDVRAELRRVLVWLDANEDKRSATVKGSKKRINTWLSRTQDAGGRNGTSKQFLSKSEQNAATFTEAAERIRSGALGTFDIFGRSPPIALAEECGPVHQRHPQLPSGGHSERDPGVVLEGETRRGDGVS